MCSWDAPVQIACATLWTWAEEQSLLEDENHESLQIPARNITQTAMSHPINVHYAQTHNNSSMLL